MYAAVRIENGRVKETLPVFCANRYSIFIRSSRQMRRPVLTVPGVQASGSSVSVQVFRHGFLSGIELSGHYRKLRAMILDRAVIVRIQDTVRHYKIFSVIQHNL